MTPAERRARGEHHVRVPGGVSEVGGFGVGYLVGLLALVCAVALTLRGTAAVRPNARLAGLTLAGALLVLLVAATAGLDDPGQRNFFYSLEDGFQVEYGRGLVMAFVACVLFAAALRLTPAAAGPARRRGRAGPGGRAPGPRRSRGGVGGPARRGRGTTRTTGCARADGPHRRAAAAVRPPRTPD